MGENYRTGADAKLTEAVGFPSLTNGGEEGLSRPLTILGKF
jgi:hypothetical protein